ncbi:MAG: hypothetical protein ABMA01_06895, partial [Chthoniobacteraceae bacterium]
MTAPSKTWKTVKSVPKTGPAVEDRSGNYAERLHKMLQQAGIEHKVVTFTFRYPTSMMVDAPAQDTAVIYRDAASPDHPWWLAAESLWSPMWLPTQSLGRQIDFYLARPSAVVSVAEYPAGTTTPAKGRRHRTKADHAASRAESHSGTAEQPPGQKTSPAGAPVLGKEPKEQPAPVGQGPAAPAPGRAPTPVGNPQDGAPDKTVPKTDPPATRPAPPKTVPVFLDLAPAPVACPSIRAVELFLNASSA